MDCAYFLWKVECPIMKLELNSKMNLNFNSFQKCDMVKYYFKFPLKCLIQ